MNARPIAWLASALAAVALLAGCGSSSSTSSSTPAATSATGSATSTGSTSPLPSLTGAAGAAAVAACKQAIQAQTTLPASAKAKLEGVCVKAAKGDQAAVKKAAQEVCEEVINKSALPAGSAKEQALSACKQK
jgi:ABC-type phosphate transport system substrate-binding protein